MADAGGIRAGRAFVELGTRDLGLQKGLALAQRRVQAFGRGINAVGKSLGGFGLTLGRLGAAALTPFGAASKTFADYDSALASLRANANPTAAELEMVKASITDISKATGFGPAKVAAAMTELLKAGLPLQTVLQGAAQAAIQFAKVAEMEVPEAATTLTDAMNVFGVDATKAVDTMSKAADASSISVRDVAMSFSMASAVAKQAGLSIEETANAIALLGQNGLKGSDAGTSLKTMLIRLLAPAEEGAKMIAALGIHVRNADGSMKDMRGIIGELQAKLSGLGKEARDKAMKDIFGTDAIRAGAILIGQGTAGWDEFNKKIGEGLPVAQKFAVLMNTLTGIAERAMAGVQRLAVAVGGALQPALSKVAGIFIDFANAVEIAVKANPGLVTGFVKMAAGAVATGAALVVAGRALTAIGAALAFAVSPLGILTAAVVGVGYAFTQFSAEGQKAVNDFMPTIMSMKETVLATFAGIADALKAGDLALAGKIFWAGLRVEWLKGTNYLMTTWEGFKAFAADVFSGISAQLEKYLVRAFFGVRSAWIATMDFMGDAFRSMIRGLASSFIDFAKLLTAVLPKHVGAPIEAAIDAAKATILKPEGGRAKIARIRERARAQVLNNMARERALGEIDDEQQQMRDARELGGNPAADARRADIEDAQAELDKLTGQAATEAGATAPDQSHPLDYVTPPLAAAQKAAEAMSEINAGLNNAARKVDVAGTFSASAAGRLSAGTSVNSLLEKQIKETEKTNKKLDKMNDKMKDGRLVAVAP